MKLSQKNANGPIHHWFGLSYASYLVKRGRFMDMKHWQQYRRGTVAQALAVDNDENYEHEGP